MKWTIAMTDLIGRLKRLIKCLIEMAIRTDDQVDCLKPLIKIVDIHDWLKRGIEAVERNG